MKKMDNIAADMIPTRLIISIAIIAAVTLLVAFGYRSLSISSAENQVEQECREVESELFSMIASGVARDVDEITADDGTIRSCSLNLPDSLIYLSFGVDPDPENDGYFKTGLTVNGTVMFYRVDGGSKKAIWLNERFKFREGFFNANRWVINGNGQGFILKGGGKSTLIFELVKKNNENFILIHENDSINP
jgi:hypothetical protein